ncbi:MAG: hypothetical protein ACHQ53_15925 [Polyangiales bacterium]
MKRSQSRLWMSPAISLIACALLGGASGCGQAAASNTPSVAVSRQDLDVSDIEKQCGLACPGDTDDKGVTIKGIAEGNAAISGVASIDAFFGSVVNFQSAATGAAGEIKAQLDAIRGDFGIDASADLAAMLQAQITANIDGSIKVSYDEPKCEADVQATLQAQARCDASFDPGKATVDCQGGCDVMATADVKCDAMADLVCTVTPPDLMCSGSCQGTCAVDVKAGAMCSGTCKGTCMGTCSAYVKDASGNAQCSGSCSGMCMGSCETELAASATCMGQCKGECTLTNPSAGCMGAVKAQCKAKAGASVKCDAKCDGDFTPPMAKAECQASAKADAKVNVQCTPPRLSASYQLKAGVDAMVQAKFEAALKTLVSARLPALLAAIKHTSSVVDAGKELVTGASAAVTAAANAAGDASLSVKAKFGLVCAGKELPKVGDIVTSSTTTLQAQLDAASKLTAVFPKS